MVEGEESEDCVYMRLKSKSSADDFGILAQTLKVGGPPLSATHLLLVFARCFAVLSARSYCSPKCEVLIIIFATRRLHVDPQHFRIG